MTSLRKRKRRGRPDRERGSWVDNSHDHHTVFYQLRMLDDDDNWLLYCQMKAAERELGEDPSLATWVEGTRQLATPTEGKKR